MNTGKISIPTIIYVVLTVANCVAGAAGSAWAGYITKPLLIPTVLYILLQYSAAPNKKLLVTGLVFSWAGDVLLMLENKNPNFFIFGLICFLTTHIFYIIYFLRIKSQDVSLLKKQPVLAVVVAAYGIALVTFLFPHLGALTVPVIVYAAVICTMLLCSLHVFLKVNHPANTWYMAGAALFVLSDSLLALNKFYQPFFAAGVLIMLTYCAAQYCIVTGYLKHRANDKV
ncbi:MAG: lysoplasmalogenase [Bacteroidetes bacterium]|nr:lysoplasmalogenase [Bacteroidota bacterium]